MEQKQLKNIIEAVLISAEKPLKVNEIEVLFAGDTDMPSRDDIRKSLQQLEEDYQDRGFELRQVASGYRIQVRQDHAQWVGRLWEEKPARYSRALLETIALIAYRQPITRGEIEEVRGVSVSSNIIKTLMEREWIRVLGHKDVPGKPALYGTTKEFLDYFNLKSLEDLPTLAEIKDLDQIHQELDLDIDNTAAAQNESGQADSETASAEPEHEDQESTVQADEESTVQADEETNVTVLADESGTVTAEVETETTQEETAAEEMAVEAVDQDDDVNTVAIEADDAESTEDDDYVESEPRAQSAAS